MAKQTTPSRGITPPKGRPTRGRFDVPSNKRVFGPVSQWIAFTVLLILAFVVLVLLTNGGDFNPLDDPSDHGAGQAGAIAGVLGAALSALISSVG